MSSDLKQRCSLCGFANGQHCVDNRCPDSSEKSGWSKTNVFTPMPAVREAPLENEIRAECQALADFLVEKNRAYGNSASEPCRIFAKRVDPLAQIDCRIDDKLNRLMKGSEYPGDDTCQDLVGYLILRRIVAAKQKKDGEA